MNPFGPKSKPSARQTVLRWWASRQQRKFELQTTRWYWTLTGKAQNLVFRLHRAVFRAQWQVREKKDAASSRFAIVKSFLGPLIVAFLTVGFVELSTHVFLQNKSYLFPYVPSFAVQSWWWVARRVATDLLSYRSFLAPIITISGAFLGLYFTALNVLISSTYKQVTGDIRRLIMRDKVGSAYIRIVAFTGSYALVVSALTVAGYTPTLTHVALLAILAVAEIYCFMNLWLRIFQLFDPTTLVAYLAKDLVQWIHEATTTGNRWTDASFQVHFQKQAEDVLSTYRNLIVTVRTEEQLRGRSLLTLSKSLLSLFWVYQIDKRAIPTQSKWFKTSFEYKDWLTASHSETSIATQTGTTLLPKEVPDLLWVEKEIGKLIDYALGSLLEKHDLDKAVDLMQNVQNVMKSMGHNLSIDEAMLLFRIVRVNTENHVKTVELPQPKPDDSTPDSFRFTAAMVDFSALCFINILLGLAERTEAITPETFRAFIEETDWRRDKSIYGKPYPRKVLQEIERTKKLRDFEQQVEGRVVTPVWFQLQLICLVYLRFLLSTIESLLDELERVFLEQAKTLINQNKFLVAFHLIERGFEACNKFSFHFHSLKERCSKFETSRILTDIPWVSFSWDEYQRRIERTHQQLVELFSKLLPPLLTLPRNQYLPDYFGQLYTVLTDECFKAMATGNEELFKKIFPTAFAACLRAHDRQKALDIVDINTKFGFCADPIIDLFDLSGYSLIFDELDGKGFWPTVKDTWEKYFATISNRAEAIRTLILFGTHRSYMMFPRSITRTSWQQWLERILRERGLMSDDMFTRFQEPTKKHSSKIINVLSRSSMLHEKARDLFIVTYFKNEIDKHEIELDPRIKRLGDELFKDKEEI